MKVAILSGKGGTGKTLVSVNLAALEKEATYVDCDAEEPNGHLFLKPNVIEEDEVFIKRPEINHQLCIGCRICEEFCQYNALAYVGSKVIVFDEVCHGCGGCSLLCPEGAISEKNKSIGRIIDGISDGTRVISGMMYVGEVSAVPIVNALNEKIKETNSIVFIDCPPGSACGTMESIKEADYCLLVVEPTIFGIHNMKMVHELCNKFQKPVGMVINKVVGENKSISRFCEENKVKVLGRIPFDHKLGMINSNGFLVVKENELYYDIFKKLLMRIKEEVAGETTVNT